MSGKWNDISGGDAERYELLAPTSRGVIERGRSAGPDAPFAAYVEEPDGAKRHADSTFDDLTEAKMWAEGEMARVLSKQAGV